MIKRRAHIKIGIIVGLILSGILLVGGAFLIGKVYDNPKVQSYAKRMYKRLMAVLPQPVSIGNSAYSMTKANYSDDVNKIALQYDLPADYLKALIVLECSGRKPVKPRFEKHVFKKLKRVRDKEGYTYEFVTHDMIKDASDEALENLARSWGPFQLMGYKCLQLDVKVNDIRGDDALDWGAKWIKLEYGHLLKNKRYKDAFHYHNAGTLFPKDSIPKTHDPDYVINGIGYMKKFK